MGRKKSKKRGKLKLEDNLLLDIGRIYTGRDEFIEAEQGLKDALDYNSNILKKGVKIIREKLERTFESNSDINSPYWNGFKIALVNNTPLKKLYEDVFWIEILGKELDKNSSNKKLPKINKCFKSMSEREKEFLYFRNLYGEQASCLLDDQCISDDLVETYEDDYDDIYEAISGAKKALPIIGFYFSGAKKLAEREMTKVLTDLSEKIDIPLEETPYCDGLIYTLGYFGCKRIYDKTLRKIEKSKKRE